MGRSANHSVKEITEPDLPTAANKPQKGVIDPNFGNGSLKTLDREFLGKALTAFFQTVPVQKMNLQSSVFNSADMNTAIIICKEEQNAKKQEKEIEKVLNQINCEVGLFINDYIEKEKEESCKKYYRDYNLYESKIDGNRLILTWY
jgi:hypothetical protein